MGMQRVTSGISWSDVELRALLEDEDSCISLEHARKHLGLHPMQLSDLTTALRDILNAGLNAYDSELKGLVISYKNPKLLSCLGGIMYDNFFVHVDVEADFYVFRLEIGRSLKGYVNKTSNNHIGILLHKTFNVSIPKPDVNPEDENQIEWPGYNVQVGQEIRFTLEEIDYKTGLPYIRGSLDPEEYLKGCKLFDEKDAASYDTEFQKITRMSISEDDMSGRKSVSFKTENKRIVFNSDSENEVDLRNGTEEKAKIKIKSEPVEEQSNTHVKKRKKKHRRNSSEGESPTENANSTNEHSFEKLRKTLIEEHPVKKQKRKFEQDSNGEHSTEDYPDEKLMKKVEEDSSSENSKSNFKGKAKKLKIISEELFANNSKINLELNNVSNGLKENPEDKPSLHKVKIKIEPSDDSSIPKRRKRKLTENSSDKESSLEQLKIKSEPKVDPDEIPKKKRKKKILFDE